MLTGKYLPASTYFTTHQVFCYNKWIKDEMSKYTLKPFSIKSLTELMHKS